MYCWITGQRHKVDGPKIYKEFKVTKSYFYFIFFFTEIEIFQQISLHFLDLKKNYTQLLDAIRQNRMKKGVTVVVFLKR